MKILEKELNKVKGKGISCSECKDKLKFIPYGHAIYCAKRKCKKCSDKEANSFGEKLMKEFAEEKSQNSKREKMEKLDSETLMCLQVAADFSGVKLPENYKNMTFDEIVDALKFESKEQEQEFMEYYYK